MVAVLPAERERGTLDHLRTTLLTNREILLGLWATPLYACAGLWVLLPVFDLAAWVVDGWIVSQTHADHPLPNPLQYLAPAFLVALPVAAASSAVGFCISTFAHTRRSALVIAVAALVLIEIWHSSASGAYGVMFSGHPWDRRGSKLSELLFFALVGCGITALFLFIARQRISARHLD